MVAGRASGIAATARLTAVRNMIPAGSPRASPTISMTAQMPITINPSRRPNSPSRCCIGVLDPTAVSSMPATSPSSVRIPVATTMPRPRPWTAVVPLNAMLMRSPMGSISDFSTPACLSTGTDLPVRAASAILRFATHVSRKSAGMMLPASMMTISPGTTSIASMYCRPPSRSTTAFAAASLRKATIAFWARNSWVRAIAALRITIAEITTVSVRSPTMPAMIAAATSTRARELWN